MITTLKLYAVLNEMQISKIPTVFEYDPELYQEGSTCTCYRGIEKIQVSGQVERKTVMIKKLKDTSTDSEKRLQEAVKNRLEYAHVFEMARNGIAMDCGLFLDASELASSTSAYNIQQCFDGKVLSQIQPHSISYELNVIASAAEILQRLQEKGYIYGDVKADNLLVKDDSTEAMLFDLNASRKSVQIQQTGVLSTNPFCPDNFDFSERHLQTLDSYMLSALLTSRLLPGADNTTILSLVELWNPKDLRQHLNPEFEDIALISDNVAEKLLAVLKKGMAVCSFDRYSGMSDFRDDLGGVIDILERIRTTQSVIAEGEQKMSKIELTLYPIEGEGDNNTDFVAKIKVAENFQPAPETPHTTNSTNDGYSPIRALGQEADLLDTDGPYAAYLKSAELDNLNAFTLYSLKSMLTGSEGTHYSWADELRDRRTGNIDKFTESIYQGISRIRFDSDEQFLWSVLPEELFNFLKGRIDEQVNRETALKGILSCNYDSAWKREICEIIRRYGTRRLLEVSRFLMDNENAFFVHERVLFKLLGEEGERLRRCYHNCSSDIRKAPYVGLAMFTIFALLGPDGFKMLLPSPRRACNLFFAL